MMNGDWSEYRCPKCDEPLQEGPAIVTRSWSYPLLGCRSCNAVYLESFLKELQESR
jgi:hypothetical protein